jgi:hypothetical protein
MLAESLRRRGARLLIYGPLTAQAAQASGLAGNNILIGGLMDPVKLSDILRRESDILFLPMSFAPEDRPNMRLAFPSKLTDYTTIGLPILFFGPEDCSAARWLRENPGAAEVVTCEDAEVLDAAIGRLVGDSAYRKQLAVAAAVAGQRCFRHDQVFGKFRRAIEEVPTAPSHQPTHL